LFNGFCTRGVDVEGIDEAVPGVSGGNTLGEDGEVAPSGVVGIEDVVFVLMMK